MHPHRGRAYRHIRNFTYNRLSCGIYGYQFDNYIALHVSLGYYSHRSLGTKPLKSDVKPNPYNV